MFIAAKRTNLRVHQLRADGQMHCILTVGHQSTTKYKDIAGTCHTTGEPQDLSEGRLGTKGHRFHKSIYIKKCTEQADRSRK